MERIIENFCELRRNHTFHRIRYEERHSYYQYIMYSELDDSVKEAQYEIDKFKDKLNDAQLSIITEFKYGYIKAMCEDTIHNIYVQIINKKEIIEYDHYIIDDVFEHMIFEKYVTKKYYNKLIDDLKNDLYLSSNDKFKDEFIMYIFKNIYLSRLNKTIIKYQFLNKSNILNFDIRNNILQFMKEDEVKPERDDLEDFRINFGKHNNQFVSYIVKNDIKYAKWLIDKKPLSYYETKCLKQLVKKEEDSKTDFVLQFGKYKNQNVSEVIKKDKRYLQWVYDNVKIANYEKQILEKLLINYNI